MVLRALAFVASTLAASVGADTPTVPRTPADLEPFMQGYYLNPRPAFAMQAFKVAERSHASGRRDKPTDESGQADARVLGFFYRLLRNDPKFRAELTKKSRADRATYTAAVSKYPATVRNVPLSLELMAWYGYAAGNFSDAPRMGLTWERSEMLMGAFLSSGDERLVHLIVNEMEFFDLAEDAKATSRFDAADVYAAGAIAQKILATESRRHPKVHAALLAAKLGADERQVRRIDIALTQSGERIWADAESYIDDKVRAGEWKRR